MADLAACYAEALFMAAKQENALPVVTDEMEILAQVFGKYAGAFYSPVFSIREQVAAIEYVLGDKFHPLTKRFFCLLASMRRLGGVKNITDVFVSLSHKETGQIDLNITVCREISQETANKIIQAAGEMGLYDLSYRENVNFRILQDSSLLGGFIVECDGKSWDCSLRTRLSHVTKIMQRR